MQFKKAITFLISQQKSQPFEQARYGAFDMSEKVICIGAAHWDIIGISQSLQKVGADVPGIITRELGGVALNVANALAGFSANPVLLSAVGTDEAGNALIEAINAKGVGTDFIYRNKEALTDSYIAIEGPDCLFAAVADARCLESSGEKIIEPLLDGSLGSLSNPYDGRLVIDGNLTNELLEAIANRSEFSKARICLASASPEKIERFQPFLGKPNVTFYVNLEEASRLCNTRFMDTIQAGQELFASGASQVLVTNGAELVTYVNSYGLISKKPPEVDMKRITGAGDMLLAAHIAAGLRGYSQEKALTFALEMAASHIYREVSV